MTKRKIKLKMIAAVILLLLFGVLIYAVRNVDVQPIQCQQLKRYWHLPRIKNQTRFQRK